MMDTASILFHYFRQKNFRQFKDREQLKLWQKKHLERVLLNAPQQYRFYNTFKQVPYAQLPIIDKKLYMKHFRDLNAFDISEERALPVAFERQQSRDFRPTLKNIRVGLSPGTSGHRALFLVSPAEQRRWAGTLLAKLLPNSIWRHCKIALCFDANANIYTNSEKKRRIQFSSFDITRPLSHLLVDLNRYQPTILVAPPALLRLLADAKELGHLHLSPKKVISVSEVLEDQDRRWIEARFRLPVHQIYQAVEGFLATTCELGTLHLNEDLFYFEEEYLEWHQERFIPIITDLFRSSQAIIRYRLDDILIKRAAPCPCGSVMTAVEKVAGRLDESLYLPSLGSANFNPVPSSKELFR